MRPLLPGPLHVVRDRLQLGLADERAHVVGLVKAGADAEVRKAGLEVWENNF